MELKSWLLDTYNEPDEEGDEEDARSNKIKLCHACKEIITVVSFKQQSQVRTRLTLVRVNVVPVESARVAFMIFAHNHSFGCIGLRRVPCARLSGMGNIL